MYKLLFLMGKIMGRLPVGLVERCSWGLAVVLFDVIRIRRGLILKNLTTAFGDELTPKQRIKVGRRSLYHFILSICEFFRSVTLKIDRDIDMVGRTHIDEALKQGKGVYVLCFHMGNWEAMGAKYSNDIVPSPILVKKVGHGGVSRFVDDLRDKNNFMTVKRQKKGDGMKAIQEILDRNEVVGFVIDQARPGEPRLPFFGEPAKTNTSFAAIWRRHPAPVIPSFILRNGLDSHVLHFLPPVDLKVTEDADKDILTHSTIFNQVVESVIRKCPEQYFWLHNRWK